MQILLASAKIMKERCKSTGLVPGIPRFQDSALMLAEDLPWGDGKVHHREPDNGAGQAEGFQLRRVQLQ